MNWMEFLRAVQLLYGSSWQTAIIEDLKEVIYLDRAILDGWEQCREPIPFLVQMTLRSRVFASRGKPSFSVVAAEPQPARIKRAASR